MKYFPYSPISKHTFFPVHVNTKKYFIGHYLHFVSIVWIFEFYPLMHLVSYTRHSAKILILNWKGIIEKISYERHAYESVEDGSLYLKRRLDYQWRPWMWMSITSTKLFRQHNCRQGRKVVFDSHIHGPNW